MALLVAIWREWMREIELAVEPEGPRSDAQPVRKLA
jgi:hypothetical protein